MSMMKYLAPCAGLLLAASPAAFAAVRYYEFHADAPLIELASGDAVLVDLLRDSAADANLHGYFDYDNEAPSGWPIGNFRGSAWGVSFDFAQAGLSFYPASHGGTLESVYVGPVQYGTPQPPVLGDYSLFLAGLQFRQDAPWIPAGIGDASLPADLTLLEGAPGLLEMCYNGPDNGFGCLFVRGVEVRPVPLPAGAGLFASALAGLATLRRSRRRT